MMKSLMVICGVLLIINVAISLWPHQSRTAPQIHAPKQDINPHFIRLNKEIEERFLDSKPDQIIDGQLDSLVANEQGGCYRLGPFMHSANYELAQAVLFNANVDYQKSTRTATESSMYRVYLGPYSTLAEATDAKAELKRSNVLDHFVRKEDEGVYMISLGIYTTEKSALGAINLFENQLDSVKMKQELVVLPDSYWLHFAIDDQNELKLQLARMDWGELSAKLGRYPCQASESIASPQT